jgi:hypothetical protein
VPACHRSVLRLQQASRQGGGRVKTTRQATTHIDALEEARRVCALCGAQVDLAAGRALPDKVGVRLDRLLASAHGHHHLSQLSTSHGEAQLTSRSQAGLSELQEGPLVEGVAPHQLIDDWLHRA